jgi:deoxyadenosine/deoxycytidine kinase
MYDYISIEGNIGAGKTSLANLLAKDMNSLLILEQFEDNSFLPKFYKEPDKYAFPLEMSFLAERYQQLKEKLGTGDLFHPLIISDYFIDKSVIFARNTLQDDEFKLYHNLFNIISSSLPKPDLLIYLYVEVPRLQQNIHSRGREYEQEIENEYLADIQKGYFEYIKRQEQLRIVIIDCNNIDFVHNPEDYKRIKDIIINKEYDYGIHRITL